MLLRIYILAALAFSTVLLWAGMANFDKPVWEFGYYLSGKLLALLAVDTGGKWIKYLPFDWDHKLKIRAVFRCLFILFLIRILWELVAMVTSYEFMMQPICTLIYLSIVICLTGYLIYSIRQYK